VSRRRSLRHPRRRKADSLVISTQIHRKKPMGRPMPRRTARANARKSAVRAAVEYVFARQKGPMGLFIRTIGIARPEPRSASPTSPTICSEWSGSLTRSRQPERQARLRQRLRCRGGDDPERRYHRSAMRQIPAPRGRNTVIGGFQLGRHEEGTCDCRAPTGFLNGNNILLTKDLVPRSVTIRLPLVTRYTSAPSTSMH
jgi:hypothetical protein